MKEAYDHLYDPDRRQEYDKLYQSTILSGRIKDQIAGLEKQLRQQADMRRAAESIVANAKKDLIRLRAEIDNIKGEKERIKRAMATEETWFLNPSIYYFFLPGKAAELTQRKQKYEADIATLIGKQRTKEKSIAHKLKGKEIFTEIVQTACAAESKITADIRKIEKD